MSSLAPQLQSFFLDRLLRQRGVSPHTIEAYRDTFRVLFSFTQQRLGKAPSDLLLDDLNASLIGAFLDHLEKNRTNSVRTRNVRLAAIHSFFRYLALREPAYAALIQQVLAIPHKRFERRLVNFLDRTEIEALLAAPDRKNWLGRRDHALLLVAIQTGLRVSELVRLRVEDLVLETPSYLRCIGKGRKERCVPLTRPVTTSLLAWLKEQRLEPTGPVFPSRGGASLSRDAVERLVAKHAANARRRCPSLGAKHVSPHVLRHTAAVQLLQAGVDRSVIALWLGHEQVETTQIYLDADLAIKEQAIARTAALPAHKARYRPSDELLAFLQAL
jgi:integrase/recombinase XerD